MAGLLRKFVKAWSEVPVEPYSIIIDDQPVIVNFRRNSRAKRIILRLTRDATSVAVTLADGTGLPDWLSFDPETLVFAGSPPADAAAILDVRVTFSRPVDGAGEPVTFVDTATIDPSAPSLSAGGIAYESHVAVFDISHGAFSASLASGRPLPDWLAFDVATRQVSLSGFEPDADAPVARLQVKFTPDTVALPEDVYASSKGGFTLEFVIQPGVAIDPAINGVLANISYFASQGLFAIDLGAAASIVATRESGAPIASWLTFDADTLSFDGLPPSEFVGTVPVRLDVTGNGTGLPTMSLISGVAVDPTYMVDDEIPGTEALSTRVARPIRSAGTSRLVLGPSIRASISPSVSSDSL